MQRRTYTIELDQETERIALLVARLQRVRVEAVIAAVLRDVFAFAEQTGERLIQESEPKH